MPGLTAVANGQLSDASQLNQYRTLFRGGNVYDVVNGYGATGDGVTNDFAAINNAITAATAKGGIVYFPPGYYSIGSTLTLPPGVHLIGTYRVGGTGTQFTGVGSQLSCTAASTPVITLNSPVGTNQFNYQASVIDGFRIAGTTQDCIYAPCGAGNLQLRNLELVPAAGRYGIYIRGQNQDWQVDTVEITGPATSVGIYVPFQQATNANNHDVWFDKAYFRKVRCGGMSNGIRFHADNIDAAPPAPRSNLIHWQNLALDLNTNDAIVLGGGARNWVFDTCNDEQTGNHAPVYTTATTTGGSATVTVASNAGLAIGNKLTIAGAGSSYAGQNQDWQEIIDNIVGTTLTMHTTAPSSVTNAEATSATASWLTCVQTQGGAPAGTLFVNCLMCASNSNGNQLYSVSLLGANQFTFLDCTLNRPIYDRGGNDAIIGAGTNFSVRPSSGAPSAPSIPASNTPLVNPWNSAVMVYVGGGTVTAIAINGVATGLTSGSFYLRLKESITLTYSVAPTTWNWVGRYA